MFRAGVTFAAVVIVAGCSGSSSSTTPAATTPAPATAPAPATGALPPGASLAPPPPKPVPEVLPDVVATVNGENVTRDDLETAIRNLEAQAGGQVPPEQRDQVVRGLLDQLVGIRLLAQEARTRNIAVDDAEVNTRIGEIRQQFPSEQVFAQQLKQRQMTLEKLRTDTRQDLAIAKMLENAIADRIGVTPEQVNDFHAKNPDRFKQPERVRASHILLGFPQNADAAARAKVRTQAESVLTQVKAGRDFAALAKQYSQDPGSAANGGDLGFFPQGQMVGAFNDVAFSLAPGATSDLVETQFGYHIIRVVEKQPARDVPLDEVRGEVARFLQDQNRQRETEAFVNGLKTKGQITIAI